jgi:hypothetical protein
VDKIAAFGTYSKCVNKLILKSHSNPVPNKFGNLRNNKIKIYGGGIKIKKYSAITVAVFLKVKHKNIAKLFSAADKRIRMAIEDKKVNNKPSLQSPIPPIKVEKVKVKKTEINKKKIEKIMLRINLEIYISMCFNPEEISFLLVP